MKERLNALGKKVQMQTIWCLRSTKGFKRRTYVPLLLAKNLGDRQKFRQKLLSPSLPDDDAPGRAFTENSWMQL